jgi:hypothetical protein
MRLRRAQFSIWDLKFQPEPGEISSLDILLRIRNLRYIGSLELQRLLNLPHSKIMFIMKNLINDRFIVEVDPYEEKRTTVYRINNDMDKAILFEIFAEWDDNYTESYPEVLKYFVNRDMPFRTLDFTGEMKIGGFLETNRFLERLCNLGLLEKTYSKSEGKGYILSKGYWDKLRNTMNEYLIHEEDYAE